MDALVKVGERQNDVFLEQAERETTVILATVIILCKCAKGDSVVHLYSGLDKCMMMYNSTLAPTNIHFLEC